jgi:ribonuclease HI
MKKLRVNSKSESPKSVEIFTDGSCIKSKYANKCGIGVHYPNGEYADISRRFTHPPYTNQRAELYAIYKGIQQVNKNDKSIDIIVYSDSEYSIKSLTVWIKTWKKNGWKTANNKPVLNQDIIMKLDELIIKHKGNVSFIHVRSHTGAKDYESAHNDIVDKLAKNGALSIQ